MAQVTLQVIVKSEQLDALQKKINELNGSKITLTVNETGVKNLNTRLLTMKTRAEEASKAVGDLEGRMKTSTQAFESDTKAIKDNTEALNDNRTANDRNSRTARKVIVDHQEHNQAVEKQGMLYKILGRSVGDFILRMTAYRAVYAGIRAITNGFVEALNTLKAVDDELVTVRKVTGFNSAEMSVIEEQAYAVASRYGVAAEDYVSGVAAFARAGYKELSSELAELAQKTMIVGDTTAEVANQFLLSVDAAYKYEGSVEKLTAVLDGANELDNKYATSIEKIAEGMGIVAPVAAQMHVGIDELAASIGTITAVTQRSGSETARALRALFLNIVGDTKTEIDEGVTWTTGEIEGLRDVIKVYAKDAYDSAQKFKTIIDPMKAMEGLSKSLKDGLLSEQELMQMVSDIGGKLRTSQLLALINNWDMYESMLDDYRSALGSADKEIDNAMDAWSRKAAVLKNTWTEFIKTGLNSSFFKGVLDFLTTIVERLDGMFPVLSRILMLVVAFNLPSIWKHLKKIGESIGDLFTAIKTGVTTTSAVLTGLSVGLTAIAVVWGVISYKIEDAKRKHEELVQSIYDTGTEAKQNSDRIMELVKSMELASAGSDEFNKAANDLADTLRIKIPEGVDAAIVKLREYARERLRTDATAANSARITAESEFVDTASDIPSELGLLLGGRSFNVFGGTSLERAIDDIRTRLQAALGTTIINPDDLDSLLEVRGALEAVIAAVDEYVYETGDASVLTSKYYTLAQEYLAGTQTVYATLVEKQKDAFDTKTAYDFFALIENRIVSSRHDLNKLISDIVQSKKYTDEEKDAMIALANAFYPQYTSAVEDATEAIEEETAAVEEETDSLFKNQDALDANADSSKKLAAAKADAEEAARKLIPVLFDEEGQLTEAGRAALEASGYLTELVLAEINLQNEIAQANYANLRAQLASVSTDALRAAYAIVAAYEAAQLARDMGYSVGNLGYDREHLPEGTGFAVGILRQLQEVESQMYGLSVQASSVGTVGTGARPSSGSSGGHGGGSSGSSSSSRQEDTRLTALQDRVSLLRSELRLAQARGDSEERQIAIMEQIMQAIMDEANYLISIGASQETINDLMTDYYNIQNDINDLLAEEEDTTDHFLENIRERIDLLESELEIANINGTTQQRIDLMEQIAAALEEERDYLISIGGDQIEINNLTAEALRIHQQISDLMEEEAEHIHQQAEAYESVREAYQALQNAQNQRNVHIYNAETGQWEWAANPSTVQSARDTLNNALQNWYAAGGGAPFLDRYGNLANNGYKGGVSNFGGTNNYGATYNIGGINISEADARAMSVYDLLQLSKSLGIYTRTA